MSQQLNRYEINYESAYKYFQDRLLDVNTLSLCLMELINFKYGDFFTLLYGNIDANRVNELAIGGMTKNSLELSRAFVLNYIQKNPQLSLIFDDFTVDLKSKIKDPFLVKYGTFYHDEFYYIINNEDVTLETLNLGFYLSNAIWHDLCVVSEVRIENKEKKLTQAQIISICKNAKLVILRCYDGEAYIFWEKLRPNNEKYCLNKDDASEVIK